MKYCKLPALLIGFVFPSLLFGQYKNFDLSKYKLPDIKIDRLDVNFNIGNFGDNERIKPSNGDKVKKLNNHFNGLLNLNYYHFRNSEKYQGNFLTNASLNRNINRYESSSYNSNSDNSRGRIFISSINRFYNKLNFIEVDPEISFISESDNYFHEAVSGPSDKNNSNQNTSRISLPISVGHGRIEPVEDLRLAIYILEELVKVGRISNMPSENVVLEMAKEISKIKSKRFFDTREKKIFELQSIDSFLLSKDIVSSSDIKYFAILNDQWDFASGPSREAGFSINAGIDNGIVLEKNLSKTSNIVDSKSKINTYGFGGFIQVRYEKPVNLYWQTSATFETSYGFEYTRNLQYINNSDEKLRTNIFNTNLSYTIQYLPNSRTSIGLSLGGDYENSKGSRTTYPDYQMKDEQFTINALFNMYYFISPRIRLQLTANISNFSHMNNSISDIKSQNTSCSNDLSLTLTYSFF